MLIIDEFADVKLVKNLESLRTQPISSLRCIHLNFAQHAPDKAALLRNEIFSSLRADLEDNAVQVYACDDGDMFVLAPNIPTKAVRALGDKLTASIKNCSFQELVGFYDLDDAINRLLSMAQEKIDHREHLLFEKKKQQELAMMEKKRREILNQAVSQTAVSQLKETRRKHACIEVMVIEDDPFSRRLVENVLQDSYGLTMLADADTALESYARKAPHILFLDINLPNVTGYDVLQRILALDPSAYIVMLSGNSDKESIMKAMQNGAKGFVGKPFTKEKLVQYIQRCTGPTA